MLPRHSLRLTGDPHVVSARGASRRGHERACEEQADERGSVTGQAESQNARSKTIQEWDGANNRLFE